MKTFLSNLQYFIVGMIYTIPIWYNIINDFNDFLNLKLFCVSALISALYAMVCSQKEKIDEINKIFKQYKNKNTYIS